MTNTNSQVLSFKVASFRKIPNPYVRSENEGETKPEMYTIIADVLDVPENIPMDTNPREQKLTTKVANKIRESLTNHTDLDFYLLNRGMLLSAKQISFDNIKNIVNIEFADNAVHGNVDGGHTYKIIKEVRNQLEPGEQFVKIEVLTGIEDIFEKLVAARNTSVQVKDQSIAELEQRFELIKDAFKSESFYDDISYKENDVKRIDVSDILSILNLFNIDKYKTNSMTSFPINSYSSKKTCIDAYINASKENEGNEANNPYVKMKPIMVDIAKLYDELEKNMGVYYKGDNPGVKKYGSVTGVSIHKSGKPDFHSKFYNEKIEYMSPNGFIYPILGAFRALVYEEDGQYKWKKDPMKVLEEIGSTLVDSTVDISRQLGNNPNATGKSQTLWANLFMCVKMQIMTEN